MGERNGKYFESDNVVRNAINGDMYDGQTLCLCGKKINAIAANCSGLYVRTCVQTKSTSIAAKIISDNENAERILAQKKHYLIVKVKKLLLIALFSLLFSLIFSLISFGMSSGFVPMMIILFVIFFIYFSIKENIIKIRK